VQETILNREKAYMRLGLSAAVGLLLFVHAWELVVYTVLIVILLLFGHFLSHSTMGEKSAHKRLNRKWLLYMSSILILGGVFGFYFFDVFRFIAVKIWDGGRVVLMGVISVLAKPLDIINFDSLSLKETLQDLEPQASETPSRELPQETSSAAEAALPSIYWLIGI